MTGPLEVALARTHEWFESNSGWAPPDPHTLQDWQDEGASRAPDECWVQGGDICAHGLATWQAILTDQARRDVLEGYNSA